MFAFVDYFVEQSKDKTAKKKLSKTATKSFNSLWQKLKKLIKDNEKQVIIIINIINNIIIIIIAIIDERDLIQ
jgi:hypothetical protein